MALRISPLNRSFSLWIIPNVSLENYNFAWKVEEFCPSFVCSDLNKAFECVGIILVKAFDIVIRVIQFTSF